MTDVCPCHGEPWLVRRDRSRPSGSSRRCRVKRQEQQRRYAQSENGRVVRRTINLTYSKSALGRKTRNEASRRRRQIPGTYEYRESKGIGAPGLTKRLRQEKLSRKRRLQERGYPTEEGNRA